MPEIGLAGVEEGGGDWEDVAERDEGRVHGAEVVRWLGGGLGHVVVVVLE